MSSLPNGMKVAAAAGLEKTIEQVFRLDPSLGIKLRRIEHKVILFTLVGPDIDLYFIPSSSGIAVMSQYEGHANCHVKGKISDFVDLILAEDMASALINGDITVSGETASLMALQEVFKDLDLDWEYELSRVVGDVAAHEIGKAVNTGLAFFQSHSTQMVNHVASSIKSEAGLIVSKESIQQFCNEVDSVTARVDRLAAKVAKLKKG